ncbi:unnamed protein product [Ixodes pacificus]
MFTNCCSCVAKNTTCSSYVDSITNCIFMLPVTNGSSYFSRITNGSSYVASITNCSSYVATNICKDPSNLCTIITNISKINFIVKKSLKLVKPMQTQGALIVRHVFQMISRKLTTLKWEHKRTLRDKMTAQHSAKSKSWGGPTQRQMVPKPFLL